MKNLKVEKRGGEIENWNYDKILLSIGKAMIPLERAEKIASQVEEWAKSQAKKGVISSEDLKDKIISLLKESDPISAEAYRVYKKG